MSPNDAIRVQDVQDVQATMQLVKAVLAVAGSIGAVVDEVLADFAVTSSAAGVLWALDPDREPPTLHDIAARLGCDPSTVSLTADKLEARGLVERRRHARDGRKRVLVLTDQGLELWTALSTRLHGSPVLADLTADDRLALLHGLARIRTTGR